ncbi:hypothetical protein AB2B38_001035 [Balneola sp. MJW-20]|uniref:hypothetical protein n=1 Tax=Gracilimonas aurantiaca TaxID=3234185 RepID=UPI0034676719
MTALIISLLFFAISFWVGYKKLFYLDQIRLINLLYTATSVLFIFIVMQLLYRSGILTQDIAGVFMTVTYSCIAGSFLGAAVKLYHQKRQSGDIRYVNQSFLTHILPNLIALALILFGLQRTSLLTDLPVTPIRLSSGISIMMIGIWGFMISLVPEFRKQSIVILDRKIPWDALVAYSWFSERVIAIEYEHNGHIKEFKTLIPDEDHLSVEEFLNEKLIEKYQKLQEKETEEVSEGS